ncbi:MAG: hypothetical protein AAF215_06695 [Cyanobacteria bacterium P01_A01_bin.123]
MTELNFPEPLTRPIPEADVDRFDPDACNMADAYADNLMTELFDDVDRLLSDEPGAIALVDPSSLNPAREDGWREGEGGTSTLMSLSGALDLPQFEGSLPDAESEQAGLTFKQRWLKRLSNRRLLLGATCMSMFFTAGLWWLNSQQKPQTAQPIAQPVASPAELQAQADGQFLEYLRRSLDVIESQSQTNAAVASNGLAAPLPAVSVNSAPAGAGALPPLPGTAAASSGSPNVIERIYIPVYQPPQATATAPNLGTGAPTPAPTAAAANPPNVAPTLTHLLVGILELGDRSAALFEVNGVPQRIYVGQNIAASGWTLVSVANQEAVIRRNGDVRSVFVGQQF